MNQKNKSKIIKTLVGVLLSVLLLFSSNFKIPILDSSTDKYFNEAISKAGIAYATCRIVNASISVVKESDLSLEPAGVGVTLALGQALDPIDDMTERLSDVLVTAITALGVQKLAYEISRSLALPVVGVLMLILTLLIWIEKSWINKVNNTVIKFAFIILIARLCLPVSSIVNEFLHTHFFEEQIALANEDLSGVTDELDKLKDVTLPESDGILGTINSSAAFLRQKIIELKKTISIAINNMGDIVETLLKLTFLYVSVFILQVIILPILVFWFFIKGFNSFVNAQ